MRRKNNVLRTEKKSHFFAVASLWTTISLLCTTPHNFLFLLSPYWIRFFFFFFCFLWQNNTLGIHFRWFIDVTWLCCSYFTCFAFSLSVPVSLFFLFLCTFQSCLSNSVFEFFSPTKSWNKNEQEEKEMGKGNNKHNPRHVTVFFVYLIFSLGTNKHLMLCLINQSIWIFNF